MQTSDAQVRAMNTFIHSWKASIDPRMKLAIASWTQPSRAYTQACSPWHAVQVVQLLLLLLPEVWHVLAAGCVA